ncbi:ROK family transcriptional regulator [Kitasatospora sp. RG8]|uniref:ROK family transcriptional regulator n=1 Tax=Kitasatospora sp. RG8 TaxID=2820815 RepID=UPI001ADEFF6C|nr:ROK family transcriptional regulator [Kitasatospora sp. RG8]MBP0448946.1 ROK family transcriptional regulator [Kitasatospora sp. RG8]
MPDTLAHPALPLGDERRFGDDRRLGDDRRIGDDRRLGDDRRIGDDRRDVNAAAVLRAVLDHGPIARSRVAALTGLSASAVSRQVVDLVQLGLLCERPELTGGGAGTVGRPQVPVDVDTGRLAVAGLHIGVPYTTFSLLDLRGNVLYRKELSNRGRTGHAVLRPLLERLPRLLATVPGGRRVVALGAVTGGTVDPERGMTVRHDPLQWENMPLGDLLSRASGLPVQVDNHARALTQAEILFGHPAARRSMVQLFVGHVVDAALAVAGTVHLGPASATGDVAHLPVPDSDALCHCGRLGCLAVAASDTTLFEAAAADGITARPDRAELIAAVRAGDPRADRLIRRRAEIVGRALALLADVVNPDLLVLTETFAVLDPAYLDVVRTEFARRSHLRRDADLLIAQSRGADALAVAAGAAVLGVLYARPLHATTVAAKASPVGPGKPL